MIAELITGITRQTCHDGLNVCAKKCMSRNAIYRMIVLFMLWAGADTVAVFAASVRQIAVLALFEGKAIISIDGKRRVLSEGQRSPEGVTLISADSNAAVLNVDGQRQRFTIGAAQSLGGYAAPRQRAITIYPDRSGMYRINGSLNGHVVNFLVDTGATTVAMNAVQAKRLGIDFRYVGRPGQVATASGVVQAYAIRLQTVKVGEIAIRDVAAVVIDGPYPQDVLLGMSFLSRIDMKRQGKKLILHQKY